ncbi:MAG: hypothetical protein JWP01_2578 [Myxococcales bacterium]|nr:hypothetical protein [Myxococcales bacterium]
MDPTDPASDPIVRLEQQVTALHARVTELEHRNPPAASRGQRVQQRIDAAEAMETTLGTYWLSRIGIVSLITGTALLIITYFGALGPILRVALGYAIAVAIGWAGLRIARRHTLFGRVIFGGGLAIAYFVTYSLHFVPSMQLIESEAIGVLLVAAAIAAIVITAHRMQSETVAGIALFLGLHTGMLSEVTVLTLVCTTLLAAGAGFFLVANRWVIVPISTVIAVYSTHATLVIDAASDVVSPGLSMAFLGVDFLLFASAPLLRTDVRVRSLMALALLNWIGLMALGSSELEEISRVALFWFLCAVAVVQAVLAGLARIRRAPRDFIAFQSALAIITIALALPAQLTGWFLIAGWTVLGLTAATVARLFNAPAFGWLALVILVLLQGYVYLEHAGAAAQLLCVLAFFTVEHVHAPDDRTSELRRLLVACVALALVRLAITAVEGGFHTIAWVVAASILFAAGFALRSSQYRWSAFVVLALSAVRLLTVELRVLSPDQRIVTFVLAGVLLLLVSFLYTRSRATRSRSAR